MEHIQELIIKGFLLSPQLFCQFLPYVRKEFFLPQFQPLVSALIAFHESYRKPPCKESLRVLLNSDFEEIEKTFFSIQEPLDKPFIGDLTKGFLRKAILRKGILDSAELLEEGEYEEIEKILQKALLPIAEKQVISSLFAYKRLVYRNIERGEPTATLLYEVDRRLGGGVFPSTLNIVMAPTNMGKSMFLINMGAAAIMQGKTVFHFSLEMSAGQVLNRYDGRVTGYTYEELEAQADKVLLRLKYLREQFRGEVYVWHFPPSTASVATIQAEMEKQIVEKKEEVGLIIVDYGDLLKHQPEKELRHRIAGSFTALRKLACDFEVPVWTATQANRGAMHKKVIRVDDAAEDFEKMRIADNVFTLSMMGSDEDSTLLLHAAKIRDGKKGWSIVLETEFSKMMIKEEGR